MSFNRMAKVAAGASALLFVAVSCTWIGPEREWNNPTTPKEPTRPLACHYESDARYCRGNKHSCSCLLKRKARAVTRGGF
jgi:hypothetical protein